MGRWVGQKMAQKIGYPLWMAPNCNYQIKKNEGEKVQNSLENIFRTWSLSAWCVAGS